jgi:hypothetical protein
VMLSQWELTLAKELRDKAEALLAHGNPGNPGDPPEPSGPPSTPSGGPYGGLSDDPRAEETD